MFSSRSSPRERLLIPLLNASGVLPPFTGEKSTDPAGTSPYRSGIAEVVRRFSTSEERRSILTGLLDYRAEMRAIGVVIGFQWLDGSFVENVETTRSRPPKDIDIVTFAHRPMPDVDRWLALVDANPHLFDSQQAKDRFNVDAYFVDMGIPAWRLVDNTVYWYGVFSHQRATSLWKGMLQVDLGDDDDAARTALAEQALVGVTNGDQPGNQGVSDSA